MSLAEGQADTSVKERERKRERNKKNGWERKREGKKMLLLFLFYYNCEESQGPDLDNNWQIIATQTLI